MTFEAATNKPEMIKKLGEIIETFKKEKKKK